jgi:hypothetical protein
MARPDSSSDSAKAVRFMLVKAAIFIGIPLLAAVAAAVNLLR